MYCMQATYGSNTGLVFERAMGLWISVLVIVVGETPPGSGLHVLPITILHYLAPFFDEKGSTTVICVSHVVGWFRVCVGSDDRQSGINCCNYEVSVADNTPT